MKSRLKMPMAVASRLAVLGLVSGAAGAGTVVCGGTVQVVSFHAPSTFMVQLSSMNTPVFICSTDLTFSVPGSQYSTSPDTCRALVAMLFAARESGRELSNVYFDGDGVPATCNAWTPWSYANIRHFYY